MKLLILGVAILATDALGPIEETETEFLVPLVDGTAQVWQKTLGEMFVAQIPPSQIPDEFDPHCFEYVGGKLVRKPPAPVSKEVKDAKSADINRWRIEANQSTFTHLGKAIACGPVHRSDIDGTAGHIALFGSFPPDFPGAWKAVDNTLIPMPNIDAFKAMYASMAAQGAANFNKSQQLKAALEAAQTQEEVDAIKW